MNRVATAATDSEITSQLEADQVQRMLEVAVNEYFRLREAGHDIAPFSEPGNVSATAVVVAVLNMLQAAEVEVFELGLMATFSE